jgi:uncharacterized membrane protein
MLRSIIVAAGVLRAAATRRPIAVASLAVGVLAAAVRIPRVWSDSLWQDEVASARILREPTFASVLHRVARTESTPPLWYALGWLLHAAGTPIVDVRLVSVAAGAATAALVVMLARRVLPLRLAVVAGLLAALGHEFLVHGHELRAYALLTLLSAVFALLLARTTAPLRRRDLVALAACTAAGLLTHYFFCFTVAAGLAWIVLEPSLRGRRRAPLAAVAAGMAVTLPWLPDALTQYHQDRFWWIGRFRLRPVVDTPLRLFTPAIRPIPLLVVCGVVFATLCVFGAIRLARTSAVGRLFVALGLGPLLLAALVWAAGVRIFALRNLVEIGPFVAVLAAASVAYLPQRARLTAAVAVATALAAGFFTFGTKPDAVPFGNIARVLVREGWGRRDPIAVFGGQNGFFSFRSPLEWYLPRQPELTLGRTTATPCDTVFAVVHSRKRAQRLRELGIAESSWIDGYDVLRLRLRGWPGEEALGRPSLITATTGHASCVSPVLAGRDRPLA